MFYLLSLLISTLAGSLYPAYASYKALRTNDASKLEIWLMYWVVRGCLVAWEMVGEWVVDWFPFYWEMKALLILWLTLPQIQGSTYIYTALIHPFLLNHEQEIDDTLAEFKGKARAAGASWINAMFKRVKEALVGGLVAEAVAAEAQPAHQQQQGTTPPPPPPAYSTAQAPVTAGFYSLVRQYGPAAVAAGTALLHPMNGRQPPTPTSREREGVVQASTNSMLRQEGQRGLGLGQLHPPRHHQGQGQEEAARRRRKAELEAELALLNSGADSTTTTAESSSSSSSLSTRSASSSISIVQQRIYHPTTRSASAGQLPPSSNLSAGLAGIGAGGGRPPNSGSGSGLRSSAADLTASSSSSLGFEEIQKDELGDFPGARSRVGSSSSGVAAAGGGGGGWWKWGVGAGAGAGAGQQQDKEKVVAQQVERKDA